MNLKNNRGQLAKWLKGYGFIEYEGRHVFVHRNSYLRGFAPEIGQIVAFDFGLAPDKNKPPMAVNIRVVKTAKSVADEYEIKRGLEVLAAKQGGAL
jgi:cold shock CspA family protein